MSDYPTSNITNPGPHDILCGRGGGTNAHPGNIKFRRLVAVHKLRYLAVSKSDKPTVAREVVKEWRSLNPPGRFLAKMDESNDENSDIPTLWYDIGDKKAREKASQCLRERNGAANEAVTALVKTVTANGEACPEDYPTLMNKAAMVKARNDVALQQQKDMISQMSKMSELSNNFGGNRSGSAEGPQPYGLSENMLNYDSNRGDSDNTVDYNDYFNQGNNPGGFNNYHFQRVQQNVNQNIPSQMNNINNMGSNYQSEDEYIEAEIKRLLQQKQAQLQMAQQHLNNDDGMAGGNRDGNIGNMTRGMGGGNMCSQNEMTRSYDDRPVYLGNQNIMTEYMQLMQKQHQMNMNSDMNMGRFNAMNRTNNINNQMNMPQSNMNYHEQLRNVVNGGFNNNNFWQSNMNNMNSANVSGNQDRMPNGGNFSTNNNAARDYLNRLQGRHKGNNTLHPENFYSRRMNNNMMDGMVINDQNNGSMIGGESGNDGRDFTIEEYHASLQEFLANDNHRDYDNKVGNNDLNQDSNVLKGKFGGEGTVIQVPTSIGDKNVAGKSGRDSMLSIGTFARNTIQSVESNYRRKSFQSVDDMDVRPTFRSIDTMDLMSITNSINHIVDDDVLRNPVMREKYSRRLSQNMDINGYQKFEGATVEAKSNYGQGRPIKVESIDPRLVAMAGAKQTVQTKQDDGPGRAERRSSMASVDSRMSFGNMSCMSELTDFGDLIVAVDGKDGEDKDLK